MSGDSLRLLTIEFGWGGVRLRHRDVVGPLLECGDQEPMDLPSDSVFVGKITPGLYARACKIAARWPEDKEFPELLLDTGRRMSCSEIIRWWQAAVLSAGRTHKGCSFLLRSISVYITGDYGECSMTLEDEFLFD